MVTHLLSDARDLSMLGGLAPTLVSGLVEAVEDECGRAQGAEGEPAKALAALVSRVTLEAPPALHEHLKLVNRRPCCDLETSGKRQ